MEPSGFVQNRLKAKASMKHRLLEKGEVIQAGDEYWSSDRLMWEPFTASVGKPEGSNHPSRRPLPEPAWIKLSDQPPTYPAWVSDGVDVSWAGKSWRSSSLGKDVPDAGSMDFDKRVTHWQPIGPKPAPPVPEKSAEDEAFEKVVADCFCPQYSPIHLRQFFKAGIEFARKGTK
jgi:hypothetical protein